MWTSLVAGVIVTGGAAGVGRGIALACGDANAYVVVASRRDNGQDVVDEITARGGAATWSACDVTDAESVARTVATTVKRAGALHAVVHNATSNRSSEPHMLETVTPELWNEHASVSLRGAYHFATAAFPALRKSHGTFLVMTSPAGVEGSATLPMYATMRAAPRLRQEPGA